jgi:ketosteroid isomerase-like protein
MIRHSAASISKEPSMIAARRTATRVALVSLVAFCGSTRPSAADSSATAAAVAEKYRRIDFGRQLDQVGTLMADDMRFVDPTAEVFGMDIAGGIRGRDAIVAAEASWELTTIGFEKRYGFSTSRWDVVAGPMVVDGGRPFPFVQILHIVDGKVEERIDYGDYGGFTTAVSEGRAKEDLALTAAVAERYVAAYVLDPNGMAAELADDARLYDPIGHDQDPSQTPDEVRGREQIRDWFARSTKTVETFELEIEGRLFSRNHAVFTTWAKGSVRTRDAQQRPKLVTMSVPLVIALEIRDGKVVRHDDYWDVDSFRDQLERGRAGE